EVERVDNRERIATIGHRIECYCSLCPINNQRCRIIVNDSSGCLRARNGSINRIGQGYKQSLVRLTLRITTYSDVEYRIYLIWTNIHDSRLSNIVTTRCGSTVSSCRRKGDRLERGIRQRDIEHNTPEATVSLNNRSIIYGDGRNRIVV